MKIKFTPEELATFIKLMRADDTDPDPEEDNKYTQAVGKAIQEAVEVETPKVTKKQKKQIDRGKIMACHEAGRSAKWIADECKCNITTVYKVIKEETEAKQ